MLGTVWASRKVTQLLHNGYTTVTGCTTGCTMIA